MKTLDWSVVKCQEHCNQIDACKGFNIEASSQTCILLNSIQSTEESYFGLCGPKKCPKGSLFLILSS